VVGKTPQMGDICGEFIKCVAHLWVNASAGSTSYLTILTERGASKNSRSPALSPDQQP